MRVVWSSYGSDALMCTDFFCIDFWGFYKLFLIISFTLSLESVLHFTVLVFSVTPFAGYRFIKVPALLSIRFSELCLDVWISLCSVSISL